MKRKKVVRVHLHFTDRKTNIFIKSGRISKLVEDDSKIFSPGTDPGDTIDKLGQLLFHVMGQSGSDEIRITWV
jgi:hypothetical protein